MKAVKLVLLLVIFSISHSISSQDLKLTSKDTIVQSSWMVGLGFNFVDDSGDEFNELFNVNEEWNSVVFPSRISIGRYFKSGLGIEAIGSYNRYKIGKRIDGAINAQESDYFSIDSRLSYDLNKIIGQTAWFDPYVGAGIGYTDANNNGRGTYNAVIGFRTWFSDRFGLDFSSSGKWAMKTEVGITNHVQHAVGVVYQFNVEKGLSKKGEKKRAQIEELMNEQQRVSDSIALDNKMKEEARLLAEKLAEEKENQRLAQAEKDKLEADQKLVEELQSKINSLGKVLFALNSSTLNTSSKNILDEINALLQSNPTIFVKLTAHTDARGTDTYNLWLSEKRMQRSLDYLVSKGLAAERINGEGLGEGQLLNKCKNGIYCKESDHRLNRRLEVLINF